MHSCEIHIIIVPVFQYLAHCAYIKGDVTGDHRERTNKRNSSGVQWPSRQQSYWTPSTGIST